MSRPVRPNSGRSSRQKNFDWIFAGGKTCDKGNALLVPYVRLALPVPARAKMSVTGTVTLVTGTVTLIAAGTRSILRLRFPIADVRFIRNIESRFRPRATFQSTRRATIQRIKNDHGRHCGYRSGALSPAKVSQRMAEYRLPRGTIAT